MDYVTNRLPDTSRSVCLPDGRLIVSTHSGLLDLPSLPLSARKCWIFKELIGSLLCPGDWADAGATVSFSKYKVIVTGPTGSTILVGDRVPGTKLWMIDLNKSHQPGQVNAATYVHRSQAQLVAWYSAVMGNPADSTLRSAVDKGILALPGLTKEAVAKNPTNSVDSSLGHLDQNKSGMRTTMTVTPLDETSTDIFPKSSLTGTQSKNRTITYKLMASKKLHALYSDLPGRFPIASSLGNEYVLVFFYEEGNYIHLEPLPNRSGDQQAKAHTRALTFFQGHGVIIFDMAMMDNETSPEVRNVYAPVCPIQFVPPNTHRANKAERAIRTFVNHFIAILCGCDPTFPMKLWDQLLPQAEVTLNLLRSSALSVHVSAYQHLCGAWDWNRYPLAPLGMLVVTLDSADSRASWADHGEQAFYLGPSMQHYRTFRVYCIRTSRQRESNTVSWHPHSKLLLPLNSPWQTFCTDISRLIDSIQTLIELPAELLQAPGTVQRTVPALLDAIQLLRNSFSATDGEMAERVTPTNSIVSSNPADSQRVTPTDVPRDVSAPIDERTTVLPTAATQRVVVDKPTTNADDDAEKILEFRRRKNKLQFKVRWLGYTEADDTWEPLANVHDCKAFQEFCVKYPQFKDLGHINTAGRFIKNSPVIKKFSAMGEKSAIGIAAAMKATRVQQPHERVVPRESPYGYIGYNMHAHKIKKDQMSMHDAIWHTCNAVGSNTTDGQTYRYHSASRGADGAKWEAAHVVELIRLLKTHQTMEFITDQELPKLDKMMYYNPVLTKKMKNGEFVYRVRGTAGGNNSTYDGPTTAYVSDMSTFKILCNKTISDEGKRMSTADISDMYLHSTLEAPEYMWIHLSDIPTEALTMFDVASYVTPGSSKVAVRIKGGMYGLPQAGMLAQEKLIKLLYDHGYYMCKHTTCLFKHDLLSTEFTLTVDDFAISHLPNELNHLLDALRTVYPITYVTGTSTIDYIGFHTEFNYDIPIRTCTVSMPGYMPAACDRFGVHPTHNTHNPEIFVPYVFGSTAPQLAKEDTSPGLSATDKTLVQQIVGVLLWYARGVDGTMLKAVNSVASAQANPTENVKTAAIQILHYGHTYPNASITYYASDMILSIDADASYLGETGARSRAASTFKFVTKDNPDYENGLIECISTIIPTIVTSAAEAEYAGLFIAGQTGLQYRYTLSDLNCPQPATRITCDNLTSGKLCHGVWKNKRNKPMDMRYHWIRDRCELKDFFIEWRKGADSIADLLTKAHPTPHFLSMRKHYVNVSEPTFPTSTDRRRNRRLKIFGPTAPPAALTSEHTTPVPANLSVQCAG